MRNGNPTLVGCSVAGLVVGAIVMLSPTRQRRLDLWITVKLRGSQRHLYLFAAVSPWFWNMFDYHQSYAAGLMTLFSVQMVAAVLILPNVNSAEVSLKRLFHLF